MADVLSELADIALGGIGLIIHNFLGILVVGLIIGIAYLHFNKPKVRDEGEILAQKQWEATKERLSLPTKKTLSLIPYPDTSNQTLSQVYTIQHQPIGNIVGINVFPIINDLKRLVELSKNPSNTNLAKIIEDNKDYIEQDKFWLVFACERRIGGKWLFPTIKKTLIMAKPNQILDMNSNDNVIRIRGLGLIPVGHYELINDEFANINRPQLQMDVIELINTEMVLSGWGTMGKVVKEAMGGDSVYRKDTALKGLQIAQQPTGQKVET